MKLHKLKAGEATGTYLVDVRTRDHIVIGNEDCVTDGRAGALMKPCC